MTYTDKKGRLIHAGNGLSKETFMTLYSINGSGEHRLKSPALPIRQTLAEAEADLAIYAKKHNFKCNQDNKKAARSGNSKAAQAKK